MTSDDLYLYASLAVIRFVHQSVRAGTWACFLFLLLLSAGCGGKPTLRVEDIRTVTFHASGRSWDQVPRSRLWLPRISGLSAGTMTSEQLLQWERTSC